MSSEDAERPGQADVPGRSSDDGHASWSADLADLFADTAFTNLFSAEIENGSASDWDVDTAGIWGADSAPDDPADGGALGLDLAL